MKLFTEQLKKYHEKYIKLLEDRDCAHEKVLSGSNIFNRVKLQKEYENARDAFDNYCTNIYAKAIFELCSSIKPKIFRVRTGECLEWEEMFGCDFNKLVDIKKSTLVGLVEDTCGYKFL